jgi:hypothetical protein
MSKLTPELIEAIQDEMHLAYNDTGQRARGYEWALNELCRKCGKPELNHRETHLFTLTQEWDKAESQLGHLMDMFTGHGVAVRREEDPPIPGEPLMSMEVARELTAALRAENERLREMNGAQGRIIDRLRRGELTDSDPLNESLTGTFSEGLEAAALRAENERLTAELTDLAYENAKLREGGDK